MSSSQNSHYNQAAGKLTGGFWLLRCLQKDIDWPRTISANLRHYQAEHASIVPETLIGHSRRSKTRAKLDLVILCVDQSGSMATSVVYASIFASVMAALPGLSTKLVCFDTSIVDLTEQLKDPVEVLFGVQLGGGTDINAALLDDRDAPHIASGVTEKCVVGERLNVNTPIP